MEPYYDRLSTGQVAYMLGVSHQTVVRWANAGIIPCERLPSTKSRGSKKKGEKRPGERRFEKSDVLKFAKSYGVTVRDIGSTRTPRQAAKQSDKEHRQDQVSRLSKLLCSADSSNCDSSKKPCEHHWMLAANLFGVGVRVT